MTVLRAEVTRSVAINILRIYVSSMLNQSLDDTQIASQASNVQRRTEVVCPGIDLSTKPYQSLYQWSMALAGRQVKGSEPVRICAINNFEHLIFMVEVCFCKCKNLNNFCSISLVDFGPIIHFNLSDVLFSLSLCLRLLALARVALDRLAHLVGIHIGLLSRILALIGSFLRPWRHAHVARLVVNALADVLHVGLLAVVSELVGLLVIVVIADIHVDVVLCIREFIPIIEVSSIIHWALRSSRVLNSPAVRPET